MCIRDRVEKVQQMEEATRKEIGTYRRDREQVADMLANSTPGPLTIKEVYEQYRVNRAKKKRKTIAEAVRKANVEGERKIAEAKAAEALAKHEKKANEIRRREQDLRNEQNRIELDRFANQQRLEKEAAEQKVREALEARARSQETQDLLAYFLQPGLSLSLIHI